MALYRCRQTHTAFQKEVPPRTGIEEHGQSTVVLDPRLVWATTASPASRLCTDEEAIVERRAEAQIATLAEQESVDLSHRHFPAPAHTEADPKAPVARVVLSTCLPRGNGQQCYANEHRPSSQHAAR